MLEVLSLLDESVQQLLQLVAALLRLLGVLGGVQHLQSLLHRVDAVLPPRLVGSQRREVVLAQLHEDD